MLAPQHTVYRAASGWFGPAVVPAGSVTGLTVEETASAVARARAGAVLFVASWRDLPGVPPVTDIAAVCEAAGIRLIVDLGAMACPEEPIASYGLPSSTVWVASGSSGMGAPGNSGFIVADAPFLHACMRAMLDEGSIGRLARPAKEAVAGLVAAVRFMRQGEKTASPAITTQLDVITGLSDLCTEFTGGSLRLRLRLASAECAEQVASRLWAADPRIYIGVSSGLLTINLNGLDSLQCEYLLASLRRAIEMEEGHIR